MKSFKLISYRLINYKNAYFFLGIFFLIYCIAIDPKGLSTNNGFSYYGTLARTIFPYTLSIIFAILLHDVSLVLNYFLLIFIL